MPVVESCTTSYEATGNFSLTKPTGLANGDRLVVMVSWEDATNPSITLPSGFSQVSGSPIVDTTGADMGLYIATKDIVNAGSEPASYSFTFSPFHWAALIRVSSPGNMALFGNSRSLEANSDVEILTAYTASVDNCVALAAIVDYAHGGFTSLPTGFANISGNGSRFVCFDSDVDTGSYAEGSTDRFGTVRWVNAVLVIEPPGSSIPSASGVGAFNWVGNAVGERVPKASGVGSFNFSGSAVGERQPVASGVGSYNFSGTAVGLTPAVNSASGSGLFQWHGTAEGKMVPKASGVGDFQWAGSAVGEKEPVANGTGIFSWHGFAIGDNGEGGGVNAGVIAQMYWWFFHEDE